MRERKFRGINIETGEWVYGDLMHCSEGQVSIFLPDSYNVSLGRSKGFAVDPKTVGQYIDKKDKDGREIYEGDVIKEEEFGGSVVKFGKGSIYIQMIGSTDGCDLDQYEEDELEKIGNIHDNPELLEKPDE